MVLATKECCAVEFDGSGESIGSLLLDSDLDTDECVRALVNFCGGDFSVALHFKLDPGITSN